ncbi:Concanavalin A-like lectin/glucanases superfamily protein [Friedmanniella luteola]|uniref:Concanavalin A-like lectin/glucanases superfamily protein n=1 Tax=Friedmanniella luteola TaxID=546871 RepID=A0A1H2A0E9_9ACTN|nr:LamG domain-containing protein [Friedmanniella luteola]SDT39142.1 Concanavalin A-like lectin/glucanases superfamily protein [Friedmanniella luteola]
MTLTPARSHPRRGRAAALALAVLAGVALGAPAATPATADTAPPAADLPATVSTDLLPTVQIDGVAWSQAVVGNRVFAGGSWSTARPAGAAAGTSTVAQPNLLSYNVTTGVMDAGFRPKVNAQILAVAASPDGRTVYIGGDFTTVDGQARNRLAAFDVATGVLKSWNPGANNKVYALAVTESAVYAGGWLTAAGGAARSSVAALNLTTGAALPFAPAVAGTENAGVRAITVSPDRTKVMLGGQFETVNGAGSPGGYGLAIVDAATGKTSSPLAANAVIRNARNAAGILSLTSSGSSVYGTGFHYAVGGPTDGNFEGAFKISWSGALEWLEDCHGDSYSVFAGQGAVYVAGHPHYCGNIGGFEQTDPISYHRALAFTPDARGTVGKEPYNYYNFAGQPKPQWLNWFPDLNSGQYTKQYQGPWHVAGNNDYVVFGGEFTTVNNKLQQGLARFARPGLAPNLDGPRLSGTSYVPKAQSFAQGIRLTWPANYDRDSEQLTYKLVRNGNSGTPIFTTTQRSTFWLRPTLSFLDTTAVAGQTYTYSVQVSDPSVNGKAPNVAKGAAISATAAGGSSLSAYDQKVLADSPQNYWRFAETSGTTVADTAGSGPATRQAGVTTGVPGARTGTAPGTAYRFSGSGSTSSVASSTAEAGKQVFSVEAWFKTSSTTGGKIVSFGSAQTGNSTNADRQVYLSNAGQVIFGTIAGSVRAIYGPSGKNDGKWHHVVATLDPSGLKLYVDGVLSASRTDYYQAQRYTGYWRVGGDVLSGWPGNPTSPYLAGDIDDVAVYDRALTAAQVAAHKAAG